MSQILPPLRRTAADAEAFARVEAATAAYCDAWISEYQELGQPIPDGMRLRAGPAYEATKRCIIEALMAAEESDSRASGRTTVTRQILDAACVACGIGFVLSTVAPWLRMAS